MDLAAYDPDPAAERQSRLWLPHGNHGAHPPIGVTWSRVHMSTNRDPAVAGRFDSLDQKALTSDVQPYLSPSAMRLPANRVHFPSCRLPSHRFVHPARQGATVGCIGCVYTIGKQATCPQTYACNTSGDSPANQHQGRARRLSIERKLGKKAAAKSESEALPRAQLVSLATEPIAAQIEELGSLVDWRRQYGELAVENKKIDQIAALEGLHAWLREARSQSEQSRTKFISLDDLPPTKRRQYDERLRDPSALSRWDELYECFVRMYTGAEWAVEEWAGTAGLPTIDLNTDNLFGPNDYTIDGRSVDVKTTIGVGRSRELRSHWSPDEKAGEIIFAVRSTANSSRAPMSRHYIQGIFDPSIYDSLPELEHFRKDRNLLNACYFHPPEDFFGMARPPSPQVPPLDADVIDYCIENGMHLGGIFRLATQDAAGLLERALPPCHHDFIPTVVELMNRGKHHLLPHYLADYLLGKILSKESIDVGAIRKVLWSIFEPYKDQKLYLGSLLRACKILPSVRCAHHENEGIGDVEIEVRERRLILRAYCRTNRKLFTTFLAYSWKTFETLVYDDPGVLVCDATGCGCLTHMYDDPEIGEVMIGRKTCGKYGRGAYELAKAARKRAHSGGSRWGVVKIP